jgi:hypothetical protein
LQGLAQRGIQRHDDEEEALNDDIAYARDSQ